MHCPYWKKIRQVSGEHVRHHQLEATIKIHILEIPNLTYHIAKIIVILRIIECYPCFSFWISNIKKKVYIHPSTIPTLTAVLCFAMFIYFLTDCISYTLIKIPASILPHISTFENMLSFELFSNDCLMFIFLFRMLGFVFYYHILLP